MKYFTIYKITNNINKKYYIGKHITNDPYDGYMGSGKAILRAIKKYGKENFTKEILYFCVDENEMNLIEEHVVNPDDKMSYNMNAGGKGGWHYINNNNITNLPEHLEIKSKKMKEYWTTDRKEKKSKKMKEYYGKHGTGKISEGLKSRYENPEYKNSFIETMMEVNRRLDKREDASIKLKEKWKDPVWKEMMLTKRKKKKEHTNETN